MEALKPFIDLFRLWSKEPERKDPQLPELFINNSIFLPEIPLMKSRGKYPNGIPEGLIIHYTGGNAQQTGKSAIEFANKNGHQYFYIDHQGNLFQQFSLDCWGYHAGESICPITKRKSVSRYYAGVEVASPGALTVKNQNYYTWYNQEVQPQNVRYFAGTNTQKIGGFFYKFTEQQENTLMALCLFFCQKLDVDPNLILGHDEVAPKRKSDPGGSLSLSMNAWRDKIKQNLLTVPSA